MVNCPKCDENISDDKNFCSNCGTQLINDKSTNQNNFVFRNKIWIIILLIIIITSLFFVLSTFNEKGGSSIPVIIKKAECGNGQCENGEDSSNCCLDCGCPGGYSCDGNVCKKNAQCGNGILETGENTDNCCADAGCSVGLTCQNNRCVELNPVIDGTFSQTTESSSVTFLKANGQGIGTVTLTNSGNDDAHNIKVVLSSPTGYFADKTIDFGTINRNSPIKKTVDLTFLDKALDVTTDEQTTIKASITFSNSANKQFSSEENFIFHLSGRNYMTWNKPEMVASWITPTQPTIREFAAKSTSGLPAGMDTSDPIIQKLAARWLFESMRAYGVKYVNDAHSSADYVQYPVETLRNQAGDCDDNAVLYASLLESIGLKSFLMLVPGHIYAGYIDSNGTAVPIETTSSNFDNALSAGNAEYVKNQDQYPLIYPTSAWSDYPSVNLPEKNPLNMPSITKQIGTCGLSFNLKNFWVASANVRFINSGSAPGAGCAAIATYQKGQMKDIAYNCWALNPGETKNVTFQPDISIFSGFSCVGY